jgi:antitoxin (DNA-binding transcriptional repressor) of toxin-antitoxin stability system
MQTLTITDAKKNLGRWLQAAARGEDIGIIAGADIIALRKVKVESADYAQREYGVTEDQLATFAQATDDRCQKLKRAGKLTLTTHAELKTLLEKAARD